MIKDKMLHESFSERCNKYEQIFIIIRLKLANLIKILYCTLWKL